MCDGNGPKERLHDVDLESNGTKELSDRSMEEKETKTVILHSAQQPNADPGPARLSRSAAASKTCH